MRIDAQILRDSWRTWIRSDLARSGPYWLQLVWTFLLATMLAVVFTLLGFVASVKRIDAWFDLGLWAFWFGKNLVVCLVVSYVIHALFELGRWLVGGPERIRRFGTSQRTLFFAGIPMLGLVLGWPLGIWLAGVGRLLPFGTPDGTRLMLATAAVSLVCTFALYHWASAKARQYLAEQRATDAQLRLLQAQIEPHFLFNTLANVHSLIDHDTVKAKRTLGAFTDYLRAGLGGLRRAHGPLADELALAEAYLRVQQSRMEERLSYRIQADAAAAQAALPPLLLQPLVENAVQHGLEPKLEGGRVEVSAHTDGRRLVIEVRDDGLGMGGSPQNGAGVALANVRERLRARYGDAASLEIVAAGPGTLARLRLPLEPSTAPAA